MNLPAPKRWRQRQPPIAVKSGATGIAVKHRETFPLS